MNRRVFIKHVSRASVAVSFANVTLPAKAVDEKPSPVMDAAKAKEWLTRWENFIVKDARNRYCDTQTGEELGWLVSPFLEGFYYGYLATRNAKWVEILVDWMDACRRRAVKEPDDFSGWPKAINEAKDVISDSLLGEAMLMRPVVLMAGLIQKSPELKSRFGSQAASYLTFAEEIFRKWDERGCWREVKEGGLWVVPAFGIEQSTGKWTAGYADRKSTGFSNPANKENLIARWLLALHDVTGKPIYRERAEKWWRLMKSRLRTRADGKYLIWNYWDPAGPWDYKPDGSTVHWVGVHPKGGYYSIDVSGMVAAYEHQLVFSKAELDGLIATNRDFMWNQQFTGAKFQRIDGKPADPRWPDSPGTLWTALVPYDDALRKIFVAQHDPGSWGGLSLTPWFLSVVNAPAR